MVKNITDRLDKLQEEYIRMIISARWDNPYRDDLRDYLLVHSNSCSQLAKILAKKRGVNEEISAIIGLLHDIGKIVSGKKENHALDGYIPAKKLLGRLGDYSEDEIELIAKAIKNHSAKAEKGNWAEEIAKDVDILDCVLFGDDFSKKEFHQKRWLDIKKELGI